MSAFSPRRVRTEGALGSSSAPSGDENQHMPPNCRSFAPRLSTIAVPYLSLGVSGLLGLTVPARAALSQGVRSATTAVRLFAVKAAEPREDGQGTTTSSRAWDGKLWLPGWVKGATTIEVRLSSAPSSAARLFVRSPDGRLSLLTTEWTSVAVQVPVVVRAISIMPPTEADGPLVVRVPVAGDVRTATARVVWPALP